MKEYIEERKEINDIIQKINKILNYNKKDLHNYLLIQLLNLSKYSEFEDLYMNLSTENKKEVLKLSKMLLEKMKSVEFKTNLAYIKIYLEYTDDESLFERLFKIHKEPKYLPEEQTKAIHKKGNLTPSDKVNECEKMDYCLPNNPLRCDKFLSKSKYGCYDCLVDYCNVQDEWEPIRYDCYSDILEKRKTNKTYRALGSLYKSKIKKDKY